MRYLIWGIGQRLQKNKDKLNWDWVIGFVDKRAGEGATYYGRPLISPDSIIRDNLDGIVISSDKYFDEIANECILERGIDCKKIRRLDYLLMKEKRDLDPGMQLAYHDVMEFVMGSEQAGIVRNWLGSAQWEGQNTSNVLNYRGYIFPIDIEMPSMRIYQVTHKLFRPVGNRGYVPVGVGSETLPYIRDNTGDHIAKYNTLINECTALYWIWKQEKTEYVGLNHYRRVFASEFNAGWALQDVEAYLLLRKYDFIVAQATVFQGYSVASLLSREICKEAFEVSWGELNRIFDQKSTEEKHAFKTVMEGQIIFPCNMFIAERTKMSEYCEWLFPILFQLIDRVEIKEEWDTYSKRVIGFWAERMFTVWLYYSGYIVKQLPVLMIGDDRPYGKCDCV